MSGNQLINKLAPLALQRFSTISGGCCSSFRSFSSSSAGASGGSAAVLSSRGVLHAEGPQLLAFLQGLVSNDVRPLASAGPSHPPVYATILTPKGKFLHDVFIHPHPSQPGALLIDIDRCGVSAALQLLNRYKLRRPISIRDVSGEFQVATCWGTSSPPAGPHWRPDPRLRELGFRAVVAASEAAALSSTGPTAAASEEDFKSLRYSLGVAEGETEIPAGQAAPLDFNVDALNGVSYTKGCYVGQERNSFTHYRGVIRKRVMPVRLELVGSGEMGGGATSWAVPPIGAEVIDPATRKSVGQIRGASLAPSSAPASSSSHSTSAPPPSSSPSAGAPPVRSWRWGIAYLKLNAASQAEAGRLELGVAPAASAAGDDGGDAAATTGGPASQERAAASGSEAAGSVGVKGEAAGDVTTCAWRVLPVRPSWWPPEWGREEANFGRGSSSESV